eukprot:c25557_g1_i1.p2 GENE.c25557_g1_i1~~c25557_g1_i1.p2  ORF type:complete len:172 (+),score=25.50 c25557_g1_i1:129-644(+)
MATTLPELSCPGYAGFVGHMGITSAIVFGCAGSAYGTAAASAGIATVGSRRPAIVMRSLIPVVMAGIVGIYGLIVAIILSSSMEPKTYPAANAFIDLGAGLAVGLAGIAAGLAIGVAGDSGVRAYAREPRVYVTMILILIFAEALGLYGLIVGIVMNGQKASQGSFKCVYS